MVVGSRAVLAYANGMHEMSLASNLLEMLRQEMEKHGATRLVEVRVCYGLLANVVPESLEFAVMALTEGTPLAGAKVTMQPISPLLRCVGCGCEFEPGDARLAVFSPCPQCGEDFGHTVLRGKELYLDSIEVE